MKLVWLTDIHLNFVTNEEITTLCKEIEQTNADAVLLGGDISEAPDLVACLEGLDDRLRRPIYYVLGNHDYYRGGIDQVREAVKALGRTRANLHWLPSESIVALTTNSGLVGHDGWSDARVGNYETSPLLLNDYRLIADFVDLDRQARRAKLEFLGDEAASHLRAVLPEALDRFSEVVVLTHVPPFREACAHSGRFDWDDWLPHFTCKAMGDVILEAAARHPERRLLVLCGHVHGSNNVMIRPNLQVITGAAEYRKPALQGMISVD